MFEIGTSLREARARRKLSYDQVEAETKIRAKYIRCLEDEQFDALPSATYVKGFLRTYADYLGLDGQLYVDEYNSRHGDMHAEDMLFRRRERPPRRQRSESSNTVLLALAAIVSVTVLFFVAWRYGEPANRPLPAARAPADVEPAQSPLVTKRTPPTTKRPRRVAPRRPPVVSLAILAEGGDCWLRIRQGRWGLQLYGTTLPAGSGLGPLRYKRGFTLEAGAPSFLRLTINKRTYRLHGSTGMWRITANGPRPIQA